MKKSLFTILFSIFLLSCVELPNLLPSGGSLSDMVEIEYEATLIGLSETYPKTVTFNDSVVITIKKVSNELECQDIGISIENGQFLKELGNYTYYDGLSNGSLLGNLTFGNWVNTYKTTERYAVPTILCGNNHLFQKNKDLYLGFRVKFQDNKWHYGWLKLIVIDTFPAMEHNLTLRSLAINKEHGVNIKIGN